MSFEFRGSRVLGTGEGFTDYEKMFVSRRKNESLCEQFGEDVTLCIQCLILYAIEIKF